MPSKHDIHDQQELLQAHRGTLSVLLRQQAITGISNAPPAVVIGINTARNEIRRIKSILRMWGQPVDEHPDDEIPFTERAASPMQEPERLRPYHNLPQPDYVRFVGREKELEWLRSCLEPDDRAWLLLITGIGGVGKSALALAIAHEFLQNYDTLKHHFEAVVWVSAKEVILTAQGPEGISLPGITLHTLEDIYSSIARALEREDITRALPEDQSSLVQKVLIEHRTLLIIDNLENVTDTRVRSFLRRVPMPTKVVVTSREWIDVAARRELFGLSEEDAESLIAEEAAVRGVILDSAQRKHLFDRTSGLPLPIKLSIARMAGGENYDQTIRWLGNAKGDLPAYCVKGQVDLAYERDPNALHLLLTCAMFDQISGVSREALGYVTDLSLADRDDGLTLLQRLSLINQNEEGRFWLLPLVQEYTRERLANAKADIALVNFSEDVLVKKWLEWSVQIVNDIGKDLGLHIDRLHDFSLEYRILQHAIRWCRKNANWGILVQLAEGTSFYPYIEGLFGEFFEILEAGIQAAQELYKNPKIDSVGLRRYERSEGRFHRRIGRVNRLQRQNALALTHLDKAEAIARRWNDEAELGRAWYVRSDVLLDEGHLLEAENLAQAMLEIGTQLDDFELKGMAGLRLSQVKARQNDFEAALKWLETAEDWAKESGWERGVARILYRRGVNLIYQHKFSEAESFLLMSLQMNISWVERRWIAHNKHRLAQVYLATGRYELAHQTAEESRDLFDRLGIPAKRREAEELLAQLQ